MIGEARPMPFYNPKYSLNLAMFATTVMPCGSNDGTLAAPAAPMAGPN